MRQSLTPAIKSQANRLKPIIGLVVIALTVTAFIYYWHHHPGLLKPLQDLTILTLVKLFCLYCLVMAALILAYDSIVRLTGIKLKRQENMQLTLYSTIVNFFGPLQSGPGLRAIYLKKRHQLSIARYARASIIYYAIFAGISGLFLLSSLSVWLFMSAVAVIVLICAAVCMTIKRLPPFRILITLLVATLAQLSFTALIYFTELRAVTPQVSFHQTLIYTGAANLALFVSLTPGALGFRESFLFLSQRLHHVNGETIIAANVIDRGFYALFLGLLFIFILLIHAKDRLALGNMRSSK